MKYVEFKDAWSKKFAGLPMKAAFGDRQFEEMMASWGLNPSGEDLKKIRPLCCGAYCLAEDEHLFYEYAEEADKALSEFLSNEEQLKDALIYEFGSHECGYTMNWKEGVLALFDDGEIKGNSLLQKVLPVAWEEYLEKYES